MGVVYEAEDRERRQRVALKALKFASADTLYRLKQEFRALAELQHPNLVTLHELFAADQCFMTMELVDGVDFLTYVKDDEMRLRATLPQLVHGLQALHDSGNIHRDVKPSNILVTKEGRLVVLDFGLVTRAEAAGPETQEGQVVGTVAYMAPEQCGGDMRLTAAADWYAMGVVLYEALTGRVPFEGPMMQVIIEKQQRAPPPPRALRPAVPKDLDELCAALLEREPGDRPDGASILRRLGVEVAEAPAGAQASATRTAAFAGRERELATLDEHFRAMIDLKESRVLVRGSSGMGKSTLVQHFLERARRGHSDLVALRGRCHERETVPYQALDSLIDDLSHYLLGLSAADAASLMPREAGLLPRLFPVLGRVPAIATAPRAREIPDPQELRTRAFSALREVLQRIGERHPLVLVLDDMHWVDASTLGVMSDILRPPDPPMMLLVLATRPEGSGPLERLVSRSESTHATIDLAPLSDAASADLAMALLGTEGAHRAEDVAREAGGNPFFLVELAKHVQTSDAEALGSIRLDDVVAERFAHLSTSGKTILELVAISDEPVTRRALATAASVTPEALSKELATLRGYHFIRAARVDDHVETYHARVRDVVLGRLDEATRRSHSKRLAFALMQWNEGTSEWLARLWRDADDRVRATEFALKAADEALFRLHFERAAELLRVAIDLKPEDPKVERALLRKLGEALSSAGRPRDAATALLRSANGADPAERLELRRRAADELLRGGYLEAGLVEVRAVLAAIKLRLAPSPLSALVSLLLRRAWITIRGLGFRERAASEIAPAELTKVDVCWSVAIGLSVVDNIRGTDGQVRHLSFALRAGEPTRVARALAIEALFLASTGVIRRSKAVTATCRALATRIGSVHSLALASMADGFVDYFCDSRWRAGVEHLGDAEGLFRRHIAAGWEIDTASMFSCLCQLYWGDVAALSRRVPALVQEAERRGDLYQGVSLRTRLNGVWLFRDEPDEAERDLDAAVGAWSSASFQVQHFFALGSRCNLEMYRGKPDAAASFVARDLKPLDRSMLPRVTMVRIEMSDIRGRIALARGVASKSDSDRARSVAIARGFARRLLKDRVPIGRQLGKLLDAGATRLAGNEALAVTKLREALAAFEEGETTLYASVARRKLGEVLGGDEGRALLTAADAWFAQQGVRNPARMTAMLVPGWS